MQKSLQGLVLSTLILGIYILSIYQIKTFDIHGHGLNQAGAALVAYHIARFGFFIGLLMAAGSLGSIILRLTCPAAKPSVSEWSAYAVCAGFLGTASLALLMVLLGFIHMYSLTLGLALTAPLVFAAPFALGEFASCLWKAHLAFFYQGPARIRLLKLLGLVLTLMGIAGVFVVKILYPESVAQNDVWEHYYHYNLLVTQEGGIWPNDVWNHFYFSKGAGLTFLVILLTDTMQAPLASGVYLALGALVLYDLVKRVTRDGLWGMTAIVIFLFYFANASSGPFPDVVPNIGKHHVAMTSLLCLVTWAVLKPLAPFRHSSYWRACLVTGCVGAFYLMVYIPLAAGLFLAITLTVVIGTFALNRSIRGAAALLPVVAAGIAGLAIVLIVNYEFTGMAETVPFRFWWRWADQQKFETRWSRYCVEYFFCEIDDSRPNVRSLLHPNVSWLLILCRAAYFWSFLRLATPLIGIGALCYYAFRQNKSSFQAMAKIEGKTRQHIMVLVLLSVVIAAALLLGSLLPSGNGTVKRLFSFLGPFIIFWFVVLWSLFLGAAFPCRSVVAASAVLPGMILPIHLFFKQPLSVPLRFVGGQISTLQALENDERKNNVIAQREAGVAAYLAAQQHLPAGGRLLSISNNTGPAYFVGSAVLSEPSYAFGKDYETILFGTPADALKALQEHQITHLAVDLESHLFGGIPFSPLFSREELRSRFRLSMRRRNFYVLTWTDEANSLPLPEAFLSKFELKRNKNNSPCNFAHYKGMAESRLKRMSLPQ